MKADLQPAPAPVPLRRAAARARPVRFSSLRWLLLAVFLPSFWIGRSAAGFSAQRSLGLLACSLLACALLLTRLRSMTSQNLWAWTILIVFLNAYYLKALWLVGKLDNPSEIARSFPDLSRVTPREVDQGQVWITAAFVTFALLSWWILTFVSRTPAKVHAPVRRAVSHQRVFHLVALVFAGYVLASIAQYALGFGVLGKVRTGGPLSTLLTRYRNDIVPAVLLLCYWLQDRRRPRSAWPTIAIVVICGVAEGFISTSRGGLFRYLLPFGFLWIITRRLHGRRVVLVAAIGFVALLMIPIVSELRLTRISPTYTSHIGAGEALARGQLVDSASLFFFRVPGADGVWLSLDYTPPTFSRSRAVEVFRTGSNQAIYTREVVGVRHEGDFRAPGIVGALMLLGGLPAVMVLMGLLVVATAALWRWVSGFQIAAVALPLACAGLFNTIGDGGLYLANIVSIPIVIGICHVVYRFVVTVPARRSLLAVPTP